MQQILSEKNRLGMIDLEERLAAIQLLANEMNEITNRNLKKINEHIHEAVYKLKIEAAKIKSTGFEPGLLLEFPDHLRLTVRVLLELGMATAEDVSKKTSRSRSMESSYLNQLTTMGYVQKQRKGQLVYYKIKFDTEKTKGD
jgi:DNA-binding transcriptional ArsR family regulator